uniref:NADH dehydrogenase subunit 6 n=1 Tax=Abacion magnum TaxID=118452 RepID=S4SZW3_ABAMA|nr:NADH dehydrogenase subunit 6 [Abacion magnum]AFR77017.1 NADH dehydrogenase subunit 6 [Abacion magnum]
MMIMSSTLLLMTSIFTQLSHPLTMGVIIIMATMMTLIFMIMTLQTSWLSYIMFMVFLGALLILFIYVSSLAPNEQFTKLNPLVTILPLMLISMTTMTPPSLDQKITYQTINFSKKLYSSMLSLTTLTLIIFLLFTLIVTVYITKFKQGPLRLI